MLSMHINRKLRVVGVLLVLCLPNYVRWLGVYNGLSVFWDNDQVGNQVYLLVVWNAITIIS